MAIYEVKREWSPEQLGYVRHFLLHNEADVKNLPACCVGSRGHVSDTDNEYVYTVNGWMLESECEEIRPGGGTSGVDEYAREQIATLTEEIAKLPTGGGGAAIIDVTALPETDIREDVFYRVRSAEFYNRSETVDYMACIIVDTLPQTGEPAVDMTMAHMAGYYAIDTGIASGYVPDWLSAYAGVPIGWYPLEMLLPITGRNYGGIVRSYSEMVDPNVFYLFVQSTVHYRTDEWRSLKGVGWDGLGYLSEIFNDVRNVASGSFSHAEGNQTKATGWAAHAEGNGTTASGDYSHAEGNGTTASGDYSHAEGGNTTASGDYSHAEGIHTIAASTDQHVQGRYNIVDNNDKYAHIVGNGTSDTELSNAHTLDWDGNAWFAGGIELTSPKGTRYRFTVSDDGTLTATVVTE